MRRSRALRVPGSFLFAVTIASAAFCALLLFAYNPEQDNVNGPVPARWQGATTTWSLNPKTGTNVHTNGGDLISTAVTNGFDTWQQTLLNMQRVNNLTVTTGPTTTLTDPNSADCVNVISFVPSSAVSFPTGTIAFTDVVSAFGPPPTNYQCSTLPGQQTCNLPSCLIDADIVFNPAEQFSTTTPPTAFDVQSVATHEIGHMLGLDHSGIAHAMMYPFGDTTAAGQQRTLAVDDVAGIAFLYPSTSFSTLTGVISGQVTLGAAGIFGSHVIAIDSASGAAVLDGMTDLQGNYKLIGLPPGNYNVLALPLAPDINSGIYILDDFAGWSCGYAGPTENSPPCCDPKTDTSCTGTPLSNPTNYTGTFF